MYGGKHVACHHSFLYNRQHAKHYSGALELTINLYKIPNLREGFGKRGDNLNGAVLEVKHLLHSPKHLPGLGCGSGRG